MKNLTVNQIKALPIKNQVECLYDLSEGDDNDDILLNFLPILKAILVINRKLSSGYKEFEKIDLDAHKKIVVDQAVKILEALSPKQILALKIENSTRPSVKDSIGFGFGSFCK